MTWQEYLQGRGIEVYPDIIKGDDRYIYYPLDVVSGGNLYHATQRREIETKTIRNFIQDDIKSPFTYFNLFAVLKGRFKSVIAVEGVEDALAVYQGTKNVVSLGGYSYNRVLFLCYLFDKVIWLHDTDEAGNGFVQKFYERAGILPIVSKIQPMSTPYKDFNQFWLEDREGASFFLEQINGGSGA